MSLSLETKVLIGLAVGAVGVLTVAALSAKPTPAKNVVLTQGVMPAIEAHVGDVLLVRTPSGEVIDVVQENAQVGLLRVPPIELSIVRITVLAVGTTSVTVEWNDTNVSMFAVNVS